MQDSFQPVTPQQPASFQPDPQPEQPPQPQQPQPVETYQPQPVAAPAPAFSDSAVGQAPNAAAPATDENPEKSYLVALALSYFLGGIGADRFYLGRIGSGVAKLLTFGGLGIWTLIDLLLIAFGKLGTKDDKRKLDGFSKNYHWVKIVTIVLIVFNILMGIIFTVFIVITATTAAKQASQSQMYETPTSSQSQIYSN